jgi:uncharacterized protein YjiK
MITKKSILPYMLKILFLNLLIIFSCAENSVPKSDKKKSSTFSRDSRTSVDLSKKLKELSGLAMSPDGRLFGHDDEKSVVYQINAKNGEIIKKFTLGEKAIKRDFEGIAIANEMFYLVTSSGEIYEFKEGDDKSNISFDIYKTKLSSKNDVEGLCYDPATNSLLLACKGHPGKNYKGSRAVYSFSLSDKKLKKKPRFLISIEEVNKFSESDFSQKLGDFFLLTEDSFAPSGIEKHPDTNSFLVLSFHGRKIVELSEKGDIIGVIMLDKKHHNQPEGITFTKDFSLVIGDEGGSGKAKITTYPADRNE